MQGLLIKVLVGNSLVIVVSFSVWLLAVMNWSNDGKLPYAEMTLIVSTLTWVSSTLLLVIIVTAIFAFGFKDQEEVESFEVLT